MKDKYRCPFEALIDIVGEKWKFLILWRLNIHDFIPLDELEMITGETESEDITQQLRELERDGLIQKISYPEIPPRTQYHITPLGRSLWPVLVSMQEWSIEYLKAREMPVADEILEEFSKVKREHKLNDMVSRLAEEPIEEIEEDLGIPFGGDE